MNINSYDQNPFPTGDPDRHYIWEMLVRRDIDAFLEQDWEKVAGDFIQENFIGINGRFKANPDSWALTYDSLKAYRDDWLQQSRNFATQKYVENPREALFDATTLRDIEVKGDSALLHKKFDGHITVVNGPKEIIRWQTLYKCVKKAGHWKITGFIGYIPNPLGN